MELALSGKIAIGGKRIRAGPPISATCFSYRPVGGGEALPIMPPTTLQQLPGPPRARRSRALGFPHFDERQVTSLGAAPGPGFDVARIKRDADAFNKAVYDIELGSHSACVIGAPFRRPELHGKVPPRD